MLTWMTSFKHYNLSTTPPWGLYRAAVVHNKCCLILCFTFMCPWYTEQLFFSNALLHICTATDIYSTPGSCPVAPSSICWAAPREQLWDKCLAQGNISGSCLRDIQVCFSVAILQSLDGRQMHDSQHSSAPPCVSTAGSYYHHSVHMAI